jgi:hypothetical protein
MRVATFMDRSAVVELDVQELKILSTALNLLCNLGCIEEEFEDSTNATIEKVESLLIAVHSLTSTLER